MMRWIGYFFLGLLLLLVLLIWIRIKVELKFTKQEQWVEVRYLMLKYRINLSDFLDMKTITEAFKKEEKTEVSEPTSEKSNEERVKAVERNLKTETSSSTGSHLKKNDEPMVSKVSSLKTEEMHTEKVKQSEETVVSSCKKKKKKRWIKAPKTRRWIKAPKVFNINFIRKINLNYLQFQYRRFKFIYKDGKIILYRLLSKIRIHRLDSILYFNVDDPILNAHLIATFWTVEANIFSFLQRRFKKVKNHKFDVKSQFSGNDIFLEMSCIVSFRMVDIIIVALLSLKEILAILKLIKLEKEV